MGEVLLALLPGVVGLVFCALLLTVLRMTDWWWRDRRDGPK